jgi:hypothetical protein
MIVIGARLVRKTMAMFARGRRERERVTSQGNSSAARGVTVLGKPLFQHIYGDRAAGIRADKHHSYDGRDGDLLFQRRWAVPIGLSALHCA